MPCEFHCGEMRPNSLKKLLQLEIKFKYSHENWALRSVYNRVYCLPMIYVTLNVLYGVMKILFTMINVSIRLLCCHTLIII